jgi:hypothetical protein
MPSASRSLSMLQDIQRQQQEQKGGPQVDVYEVRGAGKSLSMSCRDLRNEKSCVTTYAYVGLSNCIPKQKPEGESLMAAQ